MTTEPVPLLANLAQPGDLVGGKYRVERVIAVGGMGVVLAALNEDLDQQVALKILRQDALTNEEAVTRFLREARTAARLQSEHVARVFDVGTMEGGVPYMVMEFLSGLDLQQVVNARGPLPIRDAVDYTLQCLEAVAEAHAAGVVHRDLKPSNLFLASRPDGSQTIKVLDFGISKGQGLDAPAGPGLTQTKQVMGSPGFMSPEQMMTPRSVDGRTDVWSVGVVLYVLLTGEQPFQGETVAAVMANILHQPLPRVRDKRPDAPAAVERIIERCLERDVATRYLNVAQLARALAPHGSSWAKLSAARVESALGAASPAGQTLLNMAATGSTAGDVSGASWGGGGARERSRRKVVLIALATAAVVGPIVAATLLTGRTSGETPVAAASDGTEASAAAGAPAGAAEPGAATAVTAAPEATAAAAAPAASSAGAGAAAQPDAGAGAAARPVAGAGAAAKPGVAQPGVGVGAPVRPATAPKPPVTGTKEDDLLKERQ